MHNLTFKEIVFILIVYTVGILYLLTDQLFVPKNIRLYALIFTQIVMYVIIYTKLKSDKPLKLAINLALLLGIFVIPLYVIQDLMLNKNYTLKPIIITIFSLIFPFIIGSIYQVPILFRRKKS